MGLVLKAVGALKTDSRLRIDNDVTRKEIPEEFHFTRERNMIIVKDEKMPGFFIFSSQQSFDKFKTDDEFKEMDPCGVGIPLFHIVSNAGPPFGKGISGSRTFQIFQYIVQTVDKIPPYNGKEIQHSKTHVLYKLVYCTIYGNMEGSEERFSFVFNEETTDEVAMQRITKFTNLRNFDSHINGYATSWEANFIPILHSNHFKLVLNTGTCNIKIPKNERLVLAHYTDEKQDILRKQVSHQGNVFVGENSKPDNLGISDIPYATKLIASQALLIHYLEKSVGNRRRRGRRGRRRI